MSAYLETPGQSKFKSTQFEVVCLYVRNIVVAAEKVADNGTRVDYRHNT